MTSQVGKVANATIPLLAIRRHSERSEEPPTLIPEDPSSNFAAFRMT
ncbi:hypothetical protein [Legionella jamestowniensis]|nr:hypothetical protein [Legionella jamestowniensis]